MAYDERLATRVREYVASKGLPGGAVEKRMFGGLAFMANGSMCAAVVDDRLMVRVGPDAWEAALSEPFTNRMDRTGRAVTGYVFVDPAGHENDGDLQRWIDRALQFVSTLPPKTVKPPKAMVAGPAKADAPPKPTKASRPPGDHHEPPTDITSANPTPKGRTRTGDRRHGNR